MEQLKNISMECNMIKQIVDKMIKCIDSSNIEDMFKQLIMMTNQMDQMIENISQVKEALYQEIDVAEINDTLSEIIDSVQNQDYRLLKDLLQYELQEKLAEWDEIIKKSYEI